MTTRFELESPFRMSLRAAVEVGELSPARGLSACDAVAALIVTEDDRYLMQLRDEKPDIFFPGHWGAFGGAMDDEEPPDDALRRELHEELGLADIEARYFTQFTIGFSRGCDRLGEVARFYYEVPIRASRLSSLVLGEGREMQAFSPAELLAMPALVPYDSLAIWMHAARERTGPAAPGSQ